MLTALFSRVRRNPRAHLCSPQVAALVIALGLLFSMPPIAVADGGPAIAVAWTDDIYASTIIVNPAHNLVYVPTTTNDRTPVGITVYWDDPARASASLEKLEDLNIAGPAAVAGDKLFVVTRNNPQLYVYQYNPTTKRHAIVGGPMLLDGYLGPQAIAVHPNGQRIYLASYGYLKAPRVVAYEYNPVSRSIKPTATVDLPYTSFQRLALLPASPDRLFVTN